MSQAVTDTVVAFEVGTVNMDMFDWLLDMAPDTWWNETLSNGRIIGISFKYPEDAVAFKLKFAL